MNDLERARKHATIASCTTVDDYALELEDILEAIVQADRDMARTQDPQDMHAALLRARELVHSWGTS